MGNRERQGSEKQTRSADINLLILHGARRTFDTLKAGMPQENGSNGSDRLDRIERLIGAVVNTRFDMQQDRENLYHCQVVMGQKLNELAEAQKRTETNLKALILTVDETIRGRKHE